MLHVGSLGTIEAFLGKEFTAASRGRGQGGQEKQLSLLVSRFTRRKFGNG
jgi:hypothetical protein